MGALIFMPLVGARGCKGAHKGRPYEGGGGRLFPAQQARIDVYYHVLEIGSTTGGDMVFVGETSELTLYIAMPIGVVWDAGYLEAYCSASIKYLEGAIYESCRCSILR